jgi:hypothetical protein
VRVRQCRSSVSEPVSDAAAGSVGVLIDVTDSVMSLSTGRAVPWSNKGKTRAKVRIYLIVMPSSRSFMDAYISGLELLGSLIDIDRT